MASPSLVETTTETPDFTELVETHQAMVFSLAYHFLHDRAAAEEVAQDVFLQLYRHLDELQSSGKIVFWLRRVTSNRCIDEARRRQRRPEISMDSALEPAVAADETEEPLADHLRRLVASLPEKARMVVVLRYQEELEPAEIAKVLEIPLNTVKSQLQRALALLRQKAGVAERG